MNEKKASSKQDWFASYKTRSFRVGGYSVAATAMILAICIAANFLINALPSNLTKLDTSSNQLYSISQQTETILASLEEEIQIYWIVQSGQEDSTLEKLLDQYSGRSNKISVIKKDPNVHPTFVQQYTDTVYNNSLVVVCGEKSRYVNVDEIYEYDFSNYYYDGSYSSSFNGEGALTAAICYVTSEELPKIYALEGHGELSIDDSFSNALEKQNMELVELSLLSVEAIPEDADCVLIYAPQSDISVEEKKMLLTYLEQGGDLFYISTPAESEGQYANLEAVMAAYGMSATEGIVVEANQDNYWVQGPLYLLPDIRTHEITTPIDESGYYILLPLAHGIESDASVKDGLSVTTLLRSSTSAFSKVDGYALTTLEKEENDLSGPFALAAIAELSLDEENSSSVVWVASSSLLDSSVNQQVSGANQDLFLNALGYVCEQEDSISIHAKVLANDYLTVNNSSAATLSIVMVGLIPLGYLAIGVITWIRRKGR